MLFLDIMLKHMEERDHVVVTEKGNENTGKEVGKTGNDFYFKVNTNIVNLKFGESTL